jgi:predicted phosphodiesterase
MTFFLGDIHGSFAPIFHWLDRLAEKGDTLIQVGDFGLGWITKKALEELGRESKDKGVNILAIRGNHDNPRLFKDNFKTGNLELLPDYSLREVEGKQIFFIGGAISIDRTSRIEGISYWKDEEVEMWLPKVLGIHCDTVVTHSAPSFCNPTTKDFSNIQWAIDDDPALLEELPIEREYFTDVFSVLCETNPPKNWYYGHFHTSLEERIHDCKFRCLDINELWAEAY